jgi:hypothetical protein
MEDNGWGSGAETSAGLLTDSEIWDGTHDEEEDENNMGVKEAGFVDVSPERTVNIDESKIVAESEITVGLVEYLGNVAVDEGYDGEDGKVYHTDGYHIADGNDFTKQFTGENVDNADVGHEGPGYAGEPYVGDEGVYADEPYAGDEGVYADEPYAGDGGGYADEPYAGDEGVNADEPHARDEGEPYAEDEDIYADEPFEGTVDHAAEQHEGNAG